MNGIPGSGSSPSEVEKKLDQALHLSRLVGKILSELVYLKGDRLRIGRGAGSLDIAVLSGGTELKSMKVREIWLEPIAEWLYDRAWPPELSKVHEACREDFAAVVRTSAEAVKLRVHRGQQGSARGLEVELAEVKPLSDFISELGVSGDDFSGFLSLINQRSGVCLVCGASALQSSLGMKAFLCLSQAVRIPDATIASICESPPAQVQSSTIVAIESIAGDPFELLVRERKALVSCGSTMRGIICNAFVRRLCEGCARRGVPQSSWLESLPPGLRPPPDSAFMVGQGCQRCGQAGLRNLIGLQSVLLLDGEARERLKSKVSDDFLLDYFYSCGTRPLIENGLGKVRQGKLPMTSLIEAVGLPPSVYRKYYEGTREEGGPRVAPQTITAPFEDGETTVSSDRFKPMLLVVEDDPDQRSILELVFTSAGYEVMMSPDGRDALAKLEWRVPDLVITDLMMPNIDGREFVARLKLNEAWSKIPVLVLTVVSDGDQEYDLLELGADDYCEKTVQRKVLLKRVQNLLKRLNP